MARGQDALLNAARWHKLTSVKPGDFGMLLTDEGHLRVAEIAQRHGFSVSATEAMLAAMVHGNGSQAQFNHPEFGGMGQWSMGGMLMIGDMFNNGLKFRVDGLAQELSGLIGSSSLFQPARAAGAGLFAASSIWPAELGAPSSSGAQNDMQYAVFPAHHRLAVMQGGRMALYDTGNHLIGGVSQQQGGGNALLFSSQYGPVSLDSLTPVALPGTTPATAPKPAETPAEPPALTASDVASPVPAYAPTAPAPRTTTRPASDDGSIFAIIEQLHGLFSRGILTQTEFEAKKAELLGRL
ncbi:MAG: SHOCT domain-containing protein [Paracoccus sp. (in: a-proteobacteria)]|uniref:SHOCT domain-containing protein n=1 Tax=Paracoccus sp. TaxID=267 RepID=UPI0039E5B552